MDKRKNLVEKLYNDYYLCDYVKKYKIKNIEFDKQEYFIFSKINQVNNYKRIDEFIKYFSKEFLKENLNLEKFKKDTFSIEKAMNSIAYPFLLNIDRLKILEQSITNEQARMIFGISVSDIYNITGLIIIRILVYNDYLYRKKMTSDDKINFFGTTKPTCWFSPQEINLLNKSIKLENIKKYFKLFSIQLEEISTVEDTKKITKCEDSYVVMYLGEFCTYVFNYCEQLIIEFFGDSKNNNLDSYYKKRGKAFEKYVKDVLGNLYDNVITNAKYIDNKSRKMELDNLVIEDDMCINFECKSAGFNIYNSNNDKETLKNLRQSFGRGYFSINTFHKTLENNKGIIELEIKNKRQKLDLKDKKIISFNVTLYPVEFLSTSIHYFDQESANIISTFPITINIIDLYSIILLSTKNREMFKIYAKERFFSVNKMGKFKIDFDEIDAFGYVTDTSLKNGYEMMKKLINLNNNVEQEIIISNGAYRKEVNAMLASYGMYVLADKLLNEESKKVLDKMFTW